MHCPKCNTPSMKMRDKTYTCNGECEFKWDYDLYRTLYRLGLWVVDAPPVNHTMWNVDDWIKFITYHGSWKWDNKKIFIEKVIPYIQTTEISKDKSVYTFSNKDDSLLYSIELKENRWKLMNDGFYYVTGYRYNDDYGTNWLLNFIQAHKES